MTGIRRDDTDAIAGHAARVKLARVLGAPVDDLAFLEPLDIATLRSLRDQCAHRLQEADADRLGAVAASGRLLPVGIGASLAERFFGPTLVARLIGQFDAKRGASYAKHVGTEFMADVATLADPTVISRLAEHLGITTLQDITKILVQRDDLVTLSHFVGPLPASTIADILDAVDEHNTVVRIARYVEDQDALDPIVAKLSDDRLGAILLAVRDEDLWDEGLHLFAQLGDRQLQRVDAMLAAMDAIPDVVQNAVAELRAA